jgi:hypothetical protein
MTVIVWPTVTDDDGTFTTGTIYDKSFFDSIESGINTLVHSSANPTVTPVNAIDEVVTARGSAASLDARLDVEHNNDGTHNLPATVATTAVLAQSLQGVNLCGDPLMYIWSQGDTTAPDYYTVAGTGASIDRTGTGESTTTRKYGTYAAELTYGSAHAHFSQNIWATGDHAALDGFEGEKISFSVWTYTSTVNKVRAYVDDGNTETLSSYNTGGSSWQRLEVTHTISTSATKLTVGVQIEGAGDVVISAFCALLSDTSPDRFVPGQSVIGTIVWPVKGVNPVAKDGYHYAMLGRPGLIKDVQVHALRGGTSGGVDFDIEIGDGTSLVITHNSAEADLLTLNPGQGTSYQFQVLDYAQLATDNTVVTVVLNGASTTKTEGSDWAAATNDDTTATNLAAAINAISGISASASSDVVTVTIDDWVSIFNGAKSMNVTDTFANFAATPAVYNDKCLAAIHLDNGDGGTNENAVLRLNIDDADNAVDLTFFVRVLQYLRPLEDALAYNSLG